MSFVRPLDEIVKEHYVWATSSAGGRIPLGYRFFDEATSGGVALGEVCMFLARSGVGKSWFACNVVNNNQSIPTVFSSMEMQARFMLQRLAAVHYQGPTSQIENEIRETGSSEYMEAVKLDFPQLSIVDVPEMGLKQMTQANEEYSDLYGQRPMLVMIDYLELVKAGVALAGWAGFARHR